MRRWITICFLVFLTGVVRAPVWANVLYTFEGTFDTVNRRLDADVISLADKKGGETGTIHVTFNGTGEESSRLNLRLNNWLLTGFDVSSDIEAVWSSVVNDEGKDVIRGKVASRYSLIDYQPVEELRGVFFLKDGAISIDSLSFGKLALSGKMDLSAPFEMNMTMEWESISLSDFVRLWERQNRADINGLVSGEIKLDGRWSQPHLRGKLHSRDGNWEKLAYNTIRLNLEGIYPELKIGDSMVSQQNGMSFLVNGRINLSDTQNFGSQIRSLAISPLVNNTTSSKEWTIRRVEQDDSTLEFKYLLRKDTVGRGLDGGNVDMFGIEQKMEF